MARPRINPRTARSRGFIEPPPRRGPVMRLVLFVWFLIRLAVAGALAGAFAILVAAVWFGFTMPEAPEDAAARTDTVVVLTGGEGRLEVGFDLLKQGLARRMYVSGVGTTKAEVLKLLGNPAADIADRIEVGPAAHTRENAEKTAAWFNGQSLRSMRLVTNNYHLPRSLLLFQRALPGAKIVGHPVVPKGLRRDKECSDNCWWASLDGIKTVTLEAAKYLSTLLHLPFG